MKKIATIAAIAAFTTLAACSAEKVPELVADTELEPSVPADQVDPNLQQICDSQTPTAACDSDEVRNLADERAETTTPAELDDGEVHPREVSEENPAQRPR